MKYLYSLLFLLQFTDILSQGEEVGHLINNPHIESNQKFINKNSKTFDSTFIYIFDTLSLPVFDEFSKNKFQELKADFSDSDLKKDIQYLLLDATGQNILPIKTKYSVIQTYRKTFDTDNLSFTLTPLDGITIQKASFEIYPPVYSQITVYPPYTIKDSLSINNDISDTIWSVDALIYQDSATQFFKTLINKNSIWIDQNVYHNFRFGLNPWSLGVATFDGCDQNGNAYSLGTTNADYADFLTSKCIDLSNKITADSIYLSFLYQAGGFGETPDSTDSLILEFFNDDLQKWEWKWSTKGSSNLNFNVGHISIKELKYFKKGFKFRFKNYGQRSGIFDNFNIDYVHLRTLSGKKDTLFKDFAWVYPINSLLKDYTSVPWEHYKNTTSNKMSSSIPISIRNGSSIAENNSIPGKVDIIYNNNIEETFSISGNSLSNGDLNYSPRTTYTTTHNFSLGNKFDNTKTGDKQTFDILGVIGSQFPNFGQNDSTYSQQYFGNYYSYDDGSAEAAYGTIGAQSNLAVQFSPYESDSIIGIQTYFVESATDVSNKLFVFTIWSDNNGKPGSLLYEDDVYFPRTPVYNKGINNFHTYLLKNNQKIKVNGTFYIGWRQFSPERLNIGFDKNINNNSKNFYSINNGVTWVNSSVQGSIMMRPVFSTALNSELGIEEIKTNANKIQLFPNPTNDYINIEGEFLNINIYSIQGKLIETSRENKIDITNYTNGIYLFKVLNKENELTFKVIKK